MPWSFSRCLVVISNNPIDCDKSPSQSNMEDEKDINAADADAGLCFSNCLASMQDSHMASDKSPTGGYNADQRHQLT